MKKTKLLTGFAALALVVGLGACEVYVDVGDVDVGVDVNPNDSSEDNTGENTSVEESTSENTSEDTSEDNTSETTTEDNTSEDSTEGNTTETTTEDNTSEDTSEDNTSETTTEDNTSEDISEDNTSETTSEPDEVVAYALVGDFDDATWDNEPASDSVYYIPVETQSYEVTVYIANAPTDDEAWTDDNQWDPCLAVVEYGTWNHVISYDNLDHTLSSKVGDSAGPYNNIVVEWGTTYSLQIEFGETNSIAVIPQIASKWG